MTSYTFQANRIKILNDSDCLMKPKNPFCLNNIDSMTDHSDFCLDYVLTYRDFTGS